MDDCTDKLKTKKDPGQQLADPCDSSEKNLTEGSDISRRKFTRNVLVGSAVLLTLTNRSAWGAKVTPCISTNLLVSQPTMGGSMLTQPQQELVNDYEKYLNNPEYRVNKEPEDVNGVTCYEAVSNNGSDDNTDTTTETSLWFEPTTTNQ